MPHAVAHGGDHIGLVQRASQPDQVAQVLSGPFAVPGEAIDRLRGFPGTGIGQPPRMGEVVEGDHGRDPVLPAGGRHPSVVLEGRARELALFRLDTAPLQREAVARRIRVRPEGRCPRGSGGTNRRRRRSEPRNPTSGRARRPTSRCSRCHPRSDGRQWRHPTEIRRERSARARAVTVVPPESQSRRPE